MDAFGAGYKLRSQDVQVNELSSAKPTRVLSDELRTGLQMLVQTVSDLRVSQA